jgi:hypothetical protein
MEEVLFRQQTQQQQQQQTQHLQQNQQQQHQQQQRLHEMDRDLYVQRFLLQEQLQHEALSNAAAASLHASRLYFGAGGFAAQFQEQEFIRQHQEHLRRQQQQQHQHQQQQQEQHHIQQQQYLIHHAQQQASNNANTNTPSALKQSTQVSLDPQSAVSKVTQSPHLTDNPMHSQSTPTRKRSLNLGETKAEISSPNQLPLENRPDNSSAAMTTTNDTNLYNKASTSTGKKQLNMKKARKPPKLLPSNETAIIRKSLFTGGLSEGLGDKVTTNNSFMNIPRDDEINPVLDPQGNVHSTRGTFESLISAANDEEKTANAAATIASLKVTVHSDDLLDDNSKTPIISIISKKDSNLEVSNDDEVISLPNLPRLPCEPEYDPHNKSTSPVPAESVQPLDKISPQSPSSEASGKQIPDSTSKALPMITEYPYPVDTWWPSITAIRKERRMHGEKSDEEDFDEDSTMFDEPDTHFRINRAETIRRLKAELEPGVLEKLPHCRIHRMAMKSQKAASAPDHAFCWQVTENYCNEPMVCCSICNTWRHTRCGGHYKMNLSHRESTDTSFIPICDRCYTEQAILRDYPRAASRIERQRVDHFRRSLATSHVIRYASFAKHGMWPLGSVSPQNFGSHSRSVHSRHDKAEKQWSEMVTRLYSSKERSKSRTRELERLLVCVEDAEGITDRHNMRLFLHNDVQRETPVGYESRRMNILDPETSSIESDDDDEVSNANSDSDDKDDDKNNSQEDEDTAMNSEESEDAESMVTPVENLVCASPSCSRKPRFDSLFCSDACGVHMSEIDLLLTLQCAEDIHPSLLRS